MTQEEPALDTCHASQSTDNPVLWRRLERQGDTEWLVWLRKGKSEDGHRLSRTAAAL